MTMPPENGLPRRRLYSYLFTVVLCLLGGGVITWLIVNSRPEVNGTFEGRRAVSLTGPRSTAPARPPTTGVATARGEDDPYVQCAAIRRWLFDNTGGPLAFEVLTWEGYDWSFQREVAVVRVKYRAKNQLGEWQVVLRVFTFDKEGKFVSSVVEEAL
jgi:hypothetical protein